MSRARHPAVDRAVRIELLRARAALEREALCHRASQFGSSIGRMGDTLRPVALLSGLFRGRSAPQLFLRMAGLAGRYPVLTSTLSAWMMGRRRSRLLKAASAALVAWQLYGAWRKRAGDRPAEDDGRAAR